MTPAELRRERRWVVHRAKAPYQAAQPERRASSTDPSTWGSYEEALNACASGSFDGVGFVLGDGWVGVDLDHCVSDAGELHPEASGIVAALDSYTELSPSGRGLHVLARGTVPSSGKRSNVEVYDGDRYFTVTGQHLKGTPLTVEERTPQLAALHARYFGNGNGAAATAAAVSQRLPAQDDEALLAQVAAAENGKLAALMAGDWQGRYPSQSEADLALCTLLAYKTSDPEQIDRLFRLSGQYREKWERPGYREATIRKALAAAEHDRAAVEHGRGVAVALLGSALLRRWEDDPEASRHSVAAAGLPRAVRALDAPPPEPLSFLVEPALIASEYHLLCGEGGAGKTTWAVAVAAAIAGGHRLFDTFRTSSAPVYFVSEEDAAGIVLNRMDALCAGHHWDRERVLSNVHVLAQAGVSLNDTTWQRHLLADVQRTGAKLLVLDNLAELTTGPENDNHAAKAVNRFIRRLIADTGCAVLLVHHVSKPAEGRRKIDRVRGATAIANGARAVYWIESHGDTLGVETLKYNRGRKPEPYTVALNVTEQSPGTWQSAVMRCADLPPAFMQRQADVDRFVPAVREFLGQHPEGVSKSALKKGVSGDNLLIEAAFDLMCHRGEARYETPPKVGMAGRCVLVGSAS